MYTRKLVLDIRGFGKGDEEAYHALGTVWLGMYAPHDPIQLLDVFPDWNEKYRELRSTSKTLTDMKTYEDIAEFGRELPALAYPQFRIEPSYNDKKLFIMMDKSQMYAEYAPVVKWVENKAELLFDAKLMSVAQNPVNELLAAI